jgi:hypothetical protein
VSRSGARCAGATRPSARLRSPRQLARPTRARCAVEDQQLGRQAPARRRSRLGAMLAFRLARRQLAQLDCGLGGARLLRWQLAWCACAQGRCGRGDARASGSPVVSIAEFKGARLRCRWAAPPHSLRLAYGQSDGCVPRPEGRTATAPTCSPWVFVWVFVYKPNTQTNTLLPARSRSLALQLARGRGSPPLRFASTRGPPSSTNTSQMFLARPAAEW